MNTTRAMICLGLLLVLPTACRKKTGSATPAHPGGTIRADEVLTAWRDAGLAPDKFTAMTPSPYGAAYCERGLVQGLDTIVCEFNSEETMKGGIALAKQEWSAFEVSTAMAVPNKKTALFVADRNRREPSGKSMRQMAKLFAKL